VGETAPVRAVFRIVINQARLIDNPLTADLALVVPREVRGEGELPIRLSPGRIAPLVGRSYLAQEPGSIFFATMINSPG
jgi:hypothetical protein